MAVTGSIGFADGVRAQRRGSEPPRTEVELFEYTVVEGDTCAAIAERFFGHRRRYDLIHAYNPGMGPPPHDLAPGTVLRLPRRAQQAEDLADATVTAVERRVEARPRPVDETWIAARRGLELYRGGRVATQERSAAELTFRDTSVVQLREDTLVIIFGPSATTSRRAGMEATLETGALRARLGELRGGSEGNTLRVTTASGEATLAGGSAVVGVDASGTSRLSNHSSRASLRGARGGPVAVPPSTGSLVRPGERPTRPRPLPTAPRWTAGATRFLGVTGRGGDVEATWEPVPGASRYRVEIARQPDGRDVVFATEVPSEVRVFSARRLPAGRYFARLATLDAELFESVPSDALALEVVEARLLAPGEDENTPPPAHDPGDPGDESSAEIAAPAGAVLVVPPGVFCEGGPRVTLRFGVELTCRAAESGEPVATPTFVLPEPPPEPEPEPAQPMPEPAPESIRPPVREAEPIPAPLPPRLTDSYARLPIASALTLTDLDRRGSTIGLALAEVAPRRNVHGAQRTRLAIAADLSLFDDLFAIGTLVPFDLAGRYDATWERGALDVWAHVRWTPLRRDPSAETSLALALDVGAWLPTHAGDPSGLPLVRVSPSIELAYALRRVLSLRTRQGALLDLDGAGARLWASAYGVDAAVWGPIAVGIELDMVLGPEIEADLFALGLAPALSLDFAPLVLGLGMRFGLNRDGQALFGAASVALSASVAVE